MDQRLKLSPHRHTGKHLPHKHTSYGSLLFVMLLVGVFLMGATELTRAQNVTVAAVVLGPAPVHAPVITSPGSGQHFNQAPIDVAGTCDAGLLVNLYRNDVFSGNALCAQNGHFNLRMDLFIGRNDIIARMSNQADQTGPDSATVTVYFDVSSTPLNLINGSSNGTHGNVIVKAESIYKGTVPGQNLSWPIEVIGGVAPYAISIDWGDGTTDLISQPQAGQLTISHTYQKVGGYKGGYVVAIKAVDAEGTGGFMQIVAVVNNEAGTVASTTPPSSTSQWWRLLVAWPLWLIGLLMILSFWFGELRGKNRQRESQPPILPQPPVAVPSL